MGVLESVGVLEAVPPLATRDRRAVDMYRALGVRVEVIP